MAEPRDENTSSTTMESVRGVKRKHIEFLPQSSTTSACVLKPASEGPTSHDLYYSIIYPEGSNSTASALSFGERANAITVDSTSPEIVTTGTYGSAASPVDHCTVCNRPRVSGESIVQHDASFIHQVCMSHSHPPSAIDRRGKGFTYLSMHGWDPEERLGLGASGEGILHPIQPKPKAGKEGIGVKQEEGGKPKVKKHPQETLNAEAMRKLDRHEKRKHERLQRLFSGNDDVNKHLGIGF